MSLEWFVLATFGGAWLLTGIIRWRACANPHWMDVPNQRSAHSQPTPRGGGTAIALSFLSALCLLDDQPTHLRIALVGAGFGIAALGLIDDRGHVAARWRLLGHFMAAFWVLFWLGGFPPNLIPIPGGALFISVLVAIALVWLLNLYNFMDGLDGLAGTEAVFVCLSSAGLYAVSTQTLAQPELLLAAAVAGFLLWNLPPARIFMGDAGSGFLGIVLGTLLIHSAWINPKLFWSGLILLGVFIVDATLTLLRRLIQKEALYTAHRRHAYQYAARQYQSHRRITLGVLLINVLWLLPLALCVTQDILPELWGLALAYTPLIGLALHFRAGLPERPCSAHPAPERYKI